MCVDAEMLAVGQVDGDTAEQRRTDGILAANGTDGIEAH